MSKPTKLQDLLINGHTSRGDVERIARRLFVDTNELIGVIDGYVINLPNFDDLPEHVQGFIVKAILFSTVENVLDHEAEDAGSHYALAQPIEDHYNDDDEDPPGHKAP